MRTAVFILMIGLLGIGPVAATQPERRMALVIGNGDYAVGPLANPENDARLMAETLTEAGFDVSHHENLDYRNLQRAVVEFGRALAQAGEDTIGMVYYAGHAVQTDGENFLIPIDANIQDALDLEIQTLRIATLMNSLEKAGNRLNMVVLDACRNNPFKTFSRSASRGLAKTDAPFGTLLAYSTAPGDVAADGTGRNSPYTAALAKAIRTPGEPVEQVFKRVRIDVMERTGNRQVPWESSSLTGNFYFYGPTTVVEAPDTSAEIEYWKSIAASEDVGLYESYLSAYPDGLFKDLAERQISALQVAQKQEAEQALRNEQELAAQTLWVAIKDSGEASMLENLIQQYPDTVYAQLASLKLQSYVKQSEQEEQERLRQEQEAERARLEAAEPPSNIIEPEAELLFWASIKDSPNKSDYQAYLDRYPHGTFVPIAKERALSGYQPQIAALSTTPESSNPYDGDWQITWKVIRGDTYGRAWCRTGEDGTTTVSVQNGSGNATIRSSRQMPAYLSVTVSPAGEARVISQIAGASEGDGLTKFSLVDGLYEGPMMAQCEVLMTVSRKLN